MKSVQLNTFIPREKFNQLDCLGRNVLELYLPTEIVITEPRLATPKIARIYSTRYVMFGNQTTSYEQVRDLDPEFKGVYHYPQVYLWEVWVDCGYDGHVNYRFEGFVFLDDITLPIPENRKYPSRAMNSCKWDGTFKKE